MLFIQMPASRLVPWTVLLMIVLSAGAVARDDSTVRGITYGDMNADGAYQPGEPMLPGRTIVAENIQTKEKLTGETTGNGGYEIALSDGTWFIYEVQQDGWVQTEPYTVGYSVEIPADDPQQLDGLNFGDIQRGTATGHTTLTAGISDNFDLSNGDEYTTPGEDFREIEEQFPNGNLLFDIESKNKRIGHTFTHFHPRGCYVTGARLTMRIRANTTDADNDRLVFVENGGRPTGQLISTLAGFIWKKGSVTIITVDLANLPGTEVTNVLGMLQDGDFSFYIQDDTSIDFVRLEVDYSCGEAPSGKAFNDLNHNGVRNTDEPGLENWTINAYNPETKAIESTTTDVNGHYCFPSLGNGRWIIYQEQQSGWMQTIPPSVGYVVAVPGEQSMPSMDFGNTTVCGDISSKLITAGIEDDFRRDNREETSPGAALLAAIPYRPVTNAFDGQETNRAFAHTFTEVVPKGCRLTAATLTLRLRAFATGVPTDDVLHFVDNGIDIWNTTIGDYVGYSWTSGSTAVLSFDLANLPDNGSGITNILAALQDGSFDIWGQNNTSVDYMRLDVRRCCPDGAPDGSDPGRDNTRNRETMVALNPFAGSTHLVAQHYDGTAGGRYPVATPNPFSDHTELVFPLPQNVPARVVIYDIYGKTVRAFDIGSCDGGFCTVRWDGRDTTGAIVNNGVYFYRVEAAGLLYSGQLVLQR